MSHFTVAVIHEPEQSVRELLAPYEEVLHVDPESQEDKERVIRFARHSLEDCHNLSDEECWQKATEEYELGSDGLIRIPNPQGKWDWWTIGGRWTNELLTKTGEKTNEGKIADLDFSLDKKVYEESLRQWDNLVDGKDVLFFMSKNKEEILKVYKTREDFARVNAIFHTYAVITPDGEWHEPGEMCWFGITSASVKELKEWAENYQDRFLTHADPEWMMTIVDCHI